MHIQKTWSLLAAHRSETCPLKTPEVVCPLIIKLKPEAERCPWKVLMIVEVMCWRQRRLEVTEAIVQGMSTSKDKGFYGGFSSIVMLLTIYII